LEGGVLKYRVYSKVPPGFRQSGGGWRIIGLRGDLKGGGGQTVTPGGGWICLRLPALHLTEGEDVGVMKDEEIKLEEIEVSLTLGGVGR
jgi:hypothetical protein